MKNNFLALIVLAVCLLGCAQAQRKQVSYPYKASPQRESQITGGSPQVVLGMQSAQVKAILGEPDEIMDLFRRSDVEHKIHGYTYYYIIRRKASPQTESTDPEQKLIRVCFNLKNKVQSVDYWGVEKPSDNRR